MRRQKAVLVDFDCVHRTYDNLVKFVLDEQPEIAEFIWASIDAVYPEELWSSPGNSQFRRLLCWLGYFQGAGDFPEIDDAPDAERLKSSLENVRRLAKDAEETNSHKNLCFSDFPSAARYWMKDGFKVIVFSSFHDRDRMKPVIENSGLSEDVIRVKVPPNDDHSWIEQVSKDFAIDLQESFVITTSTYAATEMRANYALKTAALDRAWVSKPYDEKGRYLCIGKLTDLDPIPKMAAPDKPLTKDSSLSCHIRPDNQEGDRYLGLHPCNGYPVIVRENVHLRSLFFERSGHSVMIVGKKAGKDSPTSVPLLTGQTDEQIDLDAACQLLDLPRNLGKAHDGSQVAASVSLIGPYLRYGEVMIRMKDDDDAYTIDLARALELIEEQEIDDAKRIIQEFEDGAIRVMRGRYGSYVTDANKNARVPKDKEPQHLTLEECKELLAAARDRGRRSTKLEPKT